MKLFNTILITILVSILFSCTSVNNNRPILLAESFTYLTMHVIIEVCGPTKEHGFQCLKLEPRKYSASGSVIKHIKESSYVLTAAHFCDIDRDKVIKDVVNPTLVASLFINVKEVKVNVLIEVLDGTGFTRIGKVINTNPLLDMCILETDRINVQAIKLASAPPKIGDTIWNLASPLGIIIPNGVPILKGVYSGDVTLNAGRVVSVITDLPAVPGCSGSPVIDVRGNLIGMIYSTNMHFKELSYAVSLKQVRKYLEKVFFINKDKNPVTSGSTTLEVEIDPINTPSPPPLK